MSKEKVFIKLKDKETGRISKQVPLRDILFNRDEVEFEFKDNEIGATSLPYDDFLFFQNDYEVIVRIKNEHK